MIARFMRWLNNTLELWVRDVEHKSVELEIKKQFSLGALVQSKNASERLIILRMCRNRVLVIPYSYLTYNDISLLNINKERNLHWFSKRFREDVYYLYYDEIMLAPTPKYCDKDFLRFYDNHYE